MTPSLNEAALRAWVYRRVTQFSVPERVAVTRCLQQDCQGLENTNKAVALLKRLHEKHGVALTGEWEARFAPITPGQGPFSKPPPQREFEDPETTPMEESQWSGRRF